MKCRRTLTFPFFFVAASVDLNGEVFASVLQFVFHYLFILMIWFPVATLHQKNITWNNWITNLGDSDWHLPHLVYFCFLREGNRWPGKAEVDRPACTVLALLSFFLTRVPLVVLFCAVWEFTKKKFHIFVWLFDWSVSWLANINSYSWEKWSEQPYSAALLP